MAEKEERIYVYQFTDDDGICPLEEFCTDFPRQCGHCKEIPTRTEVIEKMAKALIRADYPNAQESIWAMRWDNPASKDYYLIMANSALNALLEGKDA